MEIEKVNSVNVCYEIEKELTDREAFEVITKKLLKDKKIKTGTIYNSCIKDELFLVNEHVGFYLSSDGNIMMSGIEAKEVGNPQYSSLFSNIDEKYLIRYVVSNIYEIKYHELLTILTRNNIIELEFADMLEKEILEEKNKKNKNMDSVFVKMTDKIAILELQFGRHSIELRLKPKDWGDAIWSSDKGEIYFDYYDGYDSLVLKSGFNNFIEEYNAVADVSIDDILQEKVAKIENGYIMGNKYYETLSDVKEAIKENNKEVADEI